MSRLGLPPWKHGRWRAWPKPTPRTTRPSPPPGRPRTRPRFGCCASTGRGAQRKRRGGTGGDALFDKSRHGGGRSTSSEEGDAREGGAERAAAANTIQTVRRGQAARVQTTTARHTHIGTTSRKEVGVAIGETDRHDRSHADRLTIEDVDEEPQTDEILF